MRDRRTRDGRKAVSLRTAREISRSRPTGAISATTAVTTVERSPSEAWLREGRSTAELRSPRSRVSARLPQYSSHTFSFITICRVTFDARCKSANGDHRIAYLVRHSHGKLLEAGNLFAVDPFLLPDEAPLDTAQAKNLGNIFEQGDKTDKGAFVLPARQQIRRGLLPDVSRSRQDVDNRPPCSFLISFFQRASKKIRLNSSVCSALKKNVTKTFLFDFFRIESQDLLTY